VKFKRNVTVFLVVSLDCTI